MVDYLTVAQWDAIDLLTKEYTKVFVEDVDVKKYDNNEIHRQMDCYEQREYLCNYFTLEAEVSDIIKGYLHGAGIVEEDDLEYVDVRMIEGFHDFMFDISNWLGDDLPQGWYCYFEDGDVWMARSWEDVEEIPEDLQELIND